MNRLTRISATVASSACLVAGFAGVAGAAPSAITGTGNDSVSTVRHTDRVRTDVNNHARVTAVSNNPQSTHTGSATLHNNRNGGDVASGAARSAADAMATVHVDGSAATNAALTNDATTDDATASDARINDTGNNSEATINTRHVTKTTVNNRSNVRVESNNSQDTASGSVSATGNRNVGDVTSGPATSDSVTTLDVSITY